MEQFAAWTEAWLRGTTNTPDGQIVLAAFEDFMKDYSQSLCRRVIEDGYGEQYPITTAGAPGFSVFAAMTTADSYKIADGNAYYTRYTKTGPVACALCGCTLNNKGSGPPAPTKKSVFIVLVEAECDIQTGFYACEHHGKFLQVVHALLNFDHVLKTSILNRNNNREPTGADFVTLLGPDYSATNKNGALKKPLLKWKPPVTDMTTVPNLVYEISNYRKALEQMLRLVELAPGGTESKRKRRKKDAPEEGQEEEEEGQEEEE
jgi:hypothetical protein